MGLALAGTYVLAQALRGPPQARDEPTPAQPASRLGWNGWMRVLKRTYAEFNDDRLLSLAAGVVFYWLLALFPAITALVSCYALFANPASISSHLAMLKQIMPDSAYSIVNGQITRITATTSGSLTLAFFVSLALAIWSANAGIKAIIDALNVVYGVKEGRSFIWLNLVSLAFTAGAIVSMLLAIAGVVVVPIVVSYLPLGGFGDTIVVWLRWPALVALLVVGLAVLYRFGPDREQPRWHWVSAGNVLAVLVWIGGSALLSFYLSNFADYGATYGSLGTAIGLMMWLWLTAIAVLLGAELNSVVEEERSSRASAALPR